MAVMLAMRFRSDGEPDLWALVSKEKSETTYQYVAAFLTDPPIVSWFYTCREADEFVERNADEFRAEYFARQFHFTGFAEKVVVELPPQGSWAVLREWGRSVRAWLEEEFPLSITRAGASASLGASHHEYRPRTYWGSLWR